MSEYVDLSGRVIEPGCFIAYGALLGRCATIRYGRVSDLAVRKSEWRREKEAPTLKAITVDCGFRGWALQNNGRPITLAFLDRLLVIDASQVAPEALALLMDEPRYTITEAGRKALEVRK